MTNEEIIKFMESDENIFHMLKDSVQIYGNYFSITLEASKDHTLCFMLMTTLPKKRQKNINKLLLEYIQGKESSFNN